MGNNIANNFDHEAHVLKSWSIQIKYRAHRALQSYIKRLLVYRGLKASKCDFKNSSHSKMYGKSHCIQFLKIKSMSPNKALNYKITQLVEHYKNVSELNLLSCFSAKFSK